MLRQFLTLLALFSGLTVAVESAQAVDIVQVVHQAQDGADCQAQSGIVAEQSDIMLSQGDNALGNLLRAPALAISTPTVMLRIDRAHE